jgi:hypothetical protein
MFTYLKIEISVDLKQQVAKGYINTPCSPKKYDSPTKKAVNTLLTEMKAATGKEGNIRMSFARIVAKFMVYKLPVRQKNYLKIQIFSLNSA